MVMNMNLSSIVLVCVLVKLVTAQAPLSGRLAGVDYRALEKKKNVEEKKWREDGFVRLPYKKGYSRLVVEVEEELAKEITRLDLNYNPIATVTKEDAEKLSALKCPPS